MNAATRHAGAAHFHRNAPGDEVLEHPRQILVITLRRPAGIAGHVDGVVHQEYPHLLAGLEQFPCKAQAVPGHIGAVIRLAIEDDQDCHCVVLFSVYWER